ncbi:zinc finger domain-containing protein [Sphingomonas aquatilis]|uniref:zinc finger domain-containing protein n=1 Tax=Sphingomonas aquatilis TaxID=93063 RepID=UPI0023F65EC1|nr:zinc finger domain-containing protein [Sphingomonas aquatilis]MCI4652589.1 hypothetical protein [Sphingomonas aquatilis]
MGSKAEIINEYEAAAATSMSPELLRWFTSYAAKSGVPRKLKIARKEGDRLFYERGELLAFDAWLRQPWPRKDGKRPGIPKAIRREIKVEANGECAMCHGHKDTCEAAHLEPVAKTDNNHPENLLWLCSNHHTAYDDGLYGPKAEDADFVGDFKRVLRRYSVMQWRMQAELSVKLLSALESCDMLKRQLDKAKTKDQVAAVESVARGILDTLPALAPISKADPRFATYNAVSVEVTALTASRKPVSQRLARATTVRAEYVAALGMVACPLCKATGRHDGEDCPVCGGDREIEERDAERLDLGQFSKVECPLCDGEGKHDGDDCPVCGGDGELERRFAEWVDVGDYAKVDCPVCKGEGVYLYEPCHACGGEGNMDRRHRDRLDTRQYEVVDCPLCEGSGRHDHEDCPECHGEREMQRRHADQVDVDGYTSVKCPVCKGSRKLRGDDCPPCDGEGRFDRRFLDRVDPRDYDLVDCPICENKAKRGRDECRACNGEGEMERRHAIYVDSRDYER